MICEKLRTLSALLFCLCLSAVAQSVQPANRITAPVDNSSRITLAGNIQPMAQARFDHGPAPASQTTGRVSLVLQRSAAQQQALNQYLSDLQNPASPRYHKWLTSSQYGAQFGISDSDLASVESWLQSQGFRIEKLPQARNIIQFSGTLGQIQAAFHTSVHRFVVNGESHIANVSDPQIPAALAPVVAGVGPLNDFHPKPTVVRGPKATYDSSRHLFQPQPSLTFPIGDAYTPFLFAVPADLATIYDTPNANLNANFAGGTSYDGTGVNVGIVGVSDLPMADVQNYRTGFLGESSTTVKLPTQVIDGNDPGVVAGAATEAILDNEIAGGLAPGANIYYYTAADTDLSYGLFDSILRAIDDNTVSILSISFGACETAEGTSGNALILEVAEQAAAQGISIVVSAGDGGSAGCDNFDTATTAQYGFAVNSFASTPYAIAVGGTDFDALSQSFTSYVTSGGQSAAGSPPYYRTALKYIPENPWNDSTTANGGLSQNVAYKDSQGSTNIVAGGGGASSIYSKPSFQTSLTPGDGQRDVPDVSLLAGNGFYQALWLLCSDSVSDGSSTGYTDCQNTNGTFQNGTYFSGVGGTSASAPAFAGMLALVSQAQGGARLGQANYVLYQLARSKPSVFHDVTIGNNSVPCVSGSPNCGANLFLTGYDAASGYDTASGLGSVDVSALINAWNAVSLNSTSTTLQINGSTAAYTGVHGASLTFNVGVAATSNGTTPTGNVAVIDNANETSGGTSSGPQNNGQIVIPLSGGTGSATYNGLPGGSYAVSARYGGDATNASSTSTPAIDVTITPETSTTALSVHAYDRTTGQPISTTNMPLGSYVFLDAQIEGTVEGGNTQGIATGTVTFTDGVPTLGVQKVSTGNQASWPPFTRSLPVLTGGQHTLAASYSGDASFEASVGMASVNVLPGPSRLSVDTEHIPSLTLSASQSGFVYATVYTDLFNGVPPPTGTDSLMQNNTVVSSAQIGGGDGGSEWMIDGQVPIRSSQLQPGLNTFTVQYSGDLNYGPSSSGPVTIDAIAPGGGVALTAPDIVSMTPGGSLTTTITLTPSGGYTGLIHWNCAVPSDLNLFLCLVPDTHVPLSGSADTVLVVFANSSTPSGNYTVKLSGYDDTATDGIEISKNITVNVTAAPPGLAVMKNGLLNVAAGSKTGNLSAISLIPSGGLTGQVNLSCAVTTSITDPQSTPICTVPASVTLSDASPVLVQVQIGTTSSTTAGSYSVSVTATSSSNTVVTSTGTVPLTVTASPSFSLSTTGTVNIHTSTNSPNAATLTITPLNGFSGSVAVSCFVEAAFTAAGSNVPTCTVPSAVTLTSANPATVNVAISTPNQNFGGLYLMTLSVVDRYSAELGIDATVDVIMTAPSFSVTKSGDITVTPGSTIGDTSTITFTPSNGFTGAVNLSCSLTSSPAGAVDVPSCSIPSSVNITGTAAATATLTVTTTAPSSAALERPLTRFFFAGGGAILAAVFFFGIPARRRAWRTLLMALAAIVIASATIGCGGGGGSGSGAGGGGQTNPGTTPGAYTITVKAADAATGNITGSTNVILTVK